MAMILTPAIIQAGMQQIDKVGWPTFHPFQLILEYNLIPPLPFETREDFLNQTLATLNAQIIQQTADIDLSMPLEERLFEVFMTRFEVLDEYKQTLNHIWQQWRQVPGSLFMCMPEWLGSLQQLFNHALAGEEDGYTHIKAKAYLFFYIQAQQVWFKDDSPDLSPTMAATHQAIQQYLEIFY